MCTWIVSISKPLLLNFADFASFYQDNTELFREYWKFYSWVSTEWKNSTKSKGKGRFMNNFSIFILSKWYLYFEHEFDFKIIGKIYETCSLWSLHLKLVGTAQKIKFSIRDFSRKCDQIRSFWRICSHLLRKSWWKTSCFFFFAVCQCFPSENYKAEMPWKIVALTIQASCKMLFENVGKIRLLSLLLHELLHLLLSRILALSSILLITQKSFC